MAEDVKEGIVKVVVDRVANPVVFGFVISWCVVNYKFFLIVVRQNDYAKVSYLLRNQLFSDKLNYTIFFFDVSQCFYLGIFLPLLLSVLYVILSPAVMVAVTYWQLHWEESLRVVKNKFDKTFSRTREEFHLLASDLKRVRDDLETAEAKLDLQYKKASEAIDIADSLSAQNAKLSEEVESLGEEVKSNKQVMENLRDEIKRLEAVCEKINPTLLSDSEIGKYSLAAIYNKYSNRYFSLNSPFSRRILEEIVVRGGKVIDSDFENIGMGKLKLGNELNNLISDGLIVRTATGYLLTDDGRALGLIIEGHLDRGSNKQ